MSTETRRIKLVVAYDGYDFCGFAPQHGQRTVYSTLIEGIRQISGDVNEITGASRTDSGAHAKWQVVHFDTSNPIPMEKWPRAVNQYLPPDLMVRHASVVPAEFHSRFWAIDRAYQYRILVGERDPRRTRYAFHYGKPIDVEAMQRASNHYVGKHSFLAFSQLFEPHKNPVRTLHSVKVRAVRDEVWIDIVGNAFIRGMMRRIAGSLWEIGRGKYDGSHIDHLFLQTNKDEIEWPPVLPACGLTLTKIRYGRHPSEKRTRFLHSGADKQDKQNE